METLLKNVEMSKKLRNSPCNDRRINVAVPAPQHTEMAKKAKIAGLSISRLYFEVVNAWLQGGSRPLVEPDKARQGPTKPDNVEPTDSISTPAVHIPQLESGPNDATDVNMDAVLERQCTANRKRQVKKKAALIPTPEQAAKKKLIESERINPTFVIERNGELTAIGDQPAQEKKGGKKKRDVAPSPKLGKALNSILKKEETSPIKPPQDAPPSVQRSLSGADLDNVPNELFAVQSAPKAHEHQTVEEL